MFEIYMGSYFFDRRALEFHYDVMDDLELDKRCENFNMMML